MKNFDLRKYLAEGRLLNEAELTDDLVQRVAQAVADEFTAEDRELDLKYVITPNSIEADPRGGGFDLDVNAGPNTPGDDWEDSRGFGIANYLGDYAGGSFVIRPEGNGHLVTNAASRNAKVAYITPEGEIEIISAEDSKADLGMTDDVETDYMERRKEMSDYMNEAYTPGSGWTKDFDYDGMLSLALKLNADSPMDLLLKVSSDLEDVNYHRENSHLTDAIDAIKAGDRVEAKIAINRFRKEVKTNLNEDTIKERKTKSNKMKKSELKEMIKSAFLNETEFGDALRKRAEEESFDDAFDRIDKEPDTYPGEKTLDPDYVKEAEEDEEEDVEVEDKEEIDVDTDAETADAGEVDVEADAEVEMTGDTKEVQDNLQAALEAAKALGDQKLVDQIGNSITFFTRTHVVGTGEVSEANVDVEVDSPVEDAKVGMDLEEAEAETQLNESINRMKKLAGLIK